MAPLIIHGFLGKGGHGTALPLSGECFGQGLPWTEFGALLGGVGAAAPGAGHSTGTAGTAHSAQKNLGKAGPKGGRAARPQLPFGEIKNAKPPVLTLITLTGLC